MICRWHIISMRNLYYLAGTDSLLSSTLQHDRNPYYYLAVWELWWFTSTSTSLQYRCSLGLTSSSWSSGAAEFKADAGLSLSLTSLTGKTLRFLILLLKFSWFSFNLKQPIRLEHDWKCFLHVLCLSNPYNRKPAWSNQPEPNSMERQIPLDSSAKITVNLDPPECLVHLLALLYQLSPTKATIKNLKN